MSKIAASLLDVHDDLVKYDGPTGQREEDGVLITPAVMQALPSSSLRLGGGIAVRAILV